MSYFIYSTEALPNPKLLGKPGYNPDGEYIRYNALTLPPIPEKAWMKLPDELTTRIKAHWVDKVGTERDVVISRFAGVIRGRFAERGVIFLDHEPTEAEKKRLEPLSLQLNDEWRKRCIDQYEQQVRDRQVTGHGRTQPTPYEDECYEILGLPKPYSVEAFKAQRMPGNEAAERIAQAVADAVKDTTAAVVAGIKQGIKNQQEAVAHK